MNSLDEFLALESMLQKSEDSLIKHQRKKHKTELIPLNMSDQTSSLITNRQSDTDEIEVLESIVLNELSKHNDIKKRDAIIRKLFSRLHRELQDKEDLRKSEELIVEELKDFTHQVKHMTFAALVAKDKSNVNSNCTTANNPNINKKCSECQTDFSPTINDSIETCRRMVVDNETNDFNIHNKLLTTTINLVNENDGNPNFDKILLEQIKQHENTIQSERQSYIDEIQRLNRIVEDKNNDIHNLREQVKRSISNSISSASSTLKSIYLDAEDSFKDYSRMQGNTSKTNGDDQVLVVLSALVKAFLDLENDIQKSLEKLGFSYNKTNKSMKLLEENNCSMQLNLTSSLDDEQVADFTFELDEDGPDLTPLSMIYSSYSLNTSFNDIEDDVVLGASHRLRHAVQHLLKVFANLVEYTRKIGTNGIDTIAILKQKDELLLELQEEVVRRDKLTTQLLEKEHLVHNLESEKNVLQDQLMDYNEIRSEHEQLKLKCAEYEHDRDRLINEHKRLEMEKSSFSQGLPQLHQSLLHENETLQRDNQTLQHEKMVLMKKINNLTSDFDLFRSEKEQVIEDKNVEIEELTSKNAASEKKCNSYKEFLEEQTQERESEREEYNKGIASLNEKLKEKEKNECRLKSSIRSLESQVTLLTEEKNSKDEQNEELSANLKDSNLKVSELNLLVKQLEAENERNSQVELELRNKLKELSNSLNIKLNDETNWKDLIDAVSKIAEAKQVNCVTVETTHPGKQLVQDEEDFTSSINSEDSVFRTIKLMDDKIQILGGQVDSLVEKNCQLEKELEQTTECALKLDKIKTEMEVLERNLHESQKQNEMLRQEINDNHMKYSELKVKLESSVDMNEFKKVVQDLKSKLQTEKKQTESVSVKLDQANRHVNDLDEKIDAYKKEIKSYKELLKSYEHDGKMSKERGDYKKKYETISNEVAQLNEKLSSKEKTISVMEQNIEMLKKKLNATNAEKDLYFEKLQSTDDGQNKIIIFEKNIEKLRLQNKMSMDKITYLELEIKSLKKKIDILEKENDYLKVENHRLSKMSVASMIPESSENNSNLDSAFASTVTLNMNGGNNSDGNLYLNGLDKISKIGVSSNNLLMLKVQRLLTQKGALIYQKNYLIHVLGGYQQTENETLSLLVNINHTKDVDECEAKLRGKQKFRSITYALVALNRMRYMANIWQCRKQQLLTNKAAHSISNNHQQLPIPPRKIASNSSLNKLSSMINTSASSSSSSSSSSPIHFSKHSSLSAHINSTMKDYVDRLHVVHETLGLHTNKQL